MTLGQPAPCPAEMVEAIAAVPLPAKFGLPARMSISIDPIQDWLWENFRIEVPIISWFNPVQKLIRVSAQMYNDIDQYRYLVEALKQMP